jgi:hypothetical protein
VTRFNRLQTMPDVHEERQTFAREWHLGGSWRLQQTSTNSSIRHQCHRREIGSSSLVALAANSLGKLDITFHDRDAIGVDGA